MDARDQAEQEKFIRDQLRKADRSPQTSTLRRDTLKRLIDLTHSPYPSLKIIAAEHMPQYIKDFPDLEDEAINAVYDLCEDQVSQVRIKGYAAIVNVSKVQQKWVKRNADVLVQLLQSDEPEEVTFVRRALTQHLDMDPAVTLGVLCDQIIPPDEPIDDEEQIIRDRLRSLVLSFITEDAKRAIVERHTSAPGSAAEGVFVSGLLKAISRLSPADTDIITKEILLVLPSFKPDSGRVQELLDTVLQLARSSSKADRESHPTNSPLTTTSYYLDLLSEIVVDRRLADPRQLMQFYSANFVSKIILSRLSQEAQVAVLSHIARILAACEERTDHFPSSYAFSKDKPTPFYNACTVLFQVFADLESRDDKAWTVCRVFLQTCARRKTNLGWTVPSTLASALQKIEQQANASRASGMDSIADVQDLIRSLLQSTNKPAAEAAPASFASSSSSAQLQQQQRPPTKTTDTIIGMVSGNRNSSGGTADRRIMNVKRKLEDNRPASLPPRPEMVTIKGASLALPIALRGDRPRGAGAGAGAAANADAMGARSNGQTPTIADDQPRAAKRAKKGGGEDREGQVPSLLSRMQSASTSANGFSIANASANRKSLVSNQNRQPELAAAPTSSAQRRKPPSDADKDPVVGFSIRGAARAANHSSPHGEERPAPASLLDRMQTDHQGGGDDTANRSSRGRRRTRNW